MRKTLPWSRDNLVGKRESSVPMTVQTQNSRRSEVEVAKDETEAEGDGVLLLCSATLI